MNMSAEWSLAMVFVFAVTLASGWQRAKIRRAVRNLSTAAQRQLGEAPTYAPPTGDALTPELADYAAVHRRVGWIVKGVWVLALLWLAYVAWLILGGI
ncbi:hypothetical protein J4E08_21155 [Sagittula sp. NFXS13]|uniref:Uncharacterized protein n=1 Tax=Sagittula marina TaxID=943940 RepID=A0A7W6DPG1_9RHOB|nr:hypothetical protein [Sagittula marina]MBB3986856.1 hypothetical protein [Sagittula marina]